MIKILIADDHELVRGGLIKVIKPEVDMCVVGEESNVVGIMNFVMKNEPDIIILDLNFPDRSGFDVLVEIKRIKPKIRVIILSMNPETIYADRALRLGAWGYLSKGSPSDEIITAIRQVMSGQKYISDKTAQVLAKHMDKDFQKPRHEDLSERELNVLIKIAQGKTIKEIAEELSISQSTVNSYRSRMLAKMNLSSNSEIIYYAIQNSLIDYKV